MFPSVVKVNNVLPPFTEVTPILVQYPPLTCRLKSIKRHLIVAKYPADYQLILFNMVTTHTSVSVNLSVKIVPLNFFYFFKLASKLFFRVISFLPLFFWIFRRFWPIKVKFFIDNLFSLVWNKVVTKMDCQQRLWVNYLIYNLDYFILKLASR